MKQPLAAVMLLSACGWLAANQVLAVEEPPDPARPAPLPVKREAQDGPLEVLSFYVGRIVPTDPRGVALRSDVLLEWGVGRQALRFRGRWSRDGFPDEFVNGLMAWDPVDRVIRISAVFYHGAWFEGTVEILDRERRIVQRRWTGHYPDGRVVPYRETWTPVGEDRFEWRIEYQRDGRWVGDHLPEGSGPPIHRIIRDTSRS